MRHAERLVLLATTLSGRWCLSDATSRHLQGGTPGTCVYAEKINGQSFESGQSATSLVTKEGSSISSANKANYLRTRTNSKGVGQYELWFIAPSLLTEGSPSSIAVDLSAQIADGEAANWFVDMYDFIEANAWVPIGDLSTAGADWTDVAITVDAGTNGPLTKYLDAGEVLLRIYSKSQNQGGPGTRQAAYLDFAQIDAGSGPSPTPVTTSAPVDGPVSAPVTPTAPTSPVATPAPVAPVAPVAPSGNVEGEAGVCVYVGKVQGVETESGQNEDSINSKEGSSISGANTASYVRTQSSSDGVGEFEMYFTPPSVVTDGTATSMTVEVSAQITDGTGENWGIYIYNFGENGYAQIGDLTSAGTDWSTTSLTISATADSPLSAYLDSPVQEILLRFYSKPQSAGGPGSEQTAYLDFVQVTASSGSGPAPTPVTTTAPVTAPVATTAPVTAPVTTTAPVPAPVATSSPIAPTAPTGTSEGEPGVCVYMGKVTGIETESGQTEASVNTKEGLTISGPNMASYVRARSTTAGAGQYEMYFTSPSLVADGSATSMTVETSTQIAEGEGKNWGIYLYDFGGANAYVQIGDLSSSGADWTDVSFTVAAAADSPLSNYVDSNEVLLLVKSNAQSQGGPGTQQMAYIDFVQLTSSTGSGPAPTPVTTTSPVAGTTAPVVGTKAPLAATAAPVVATTAPAVATTAPAVATTAPVVVTAPPVTVGEQQRWEAFAQFVPDWVEWKAKLGNGACDPLESCKTDSACCDSSTTAVCGNGLCEETETRDNCNEDCTHLLSICGNGVCENNRDEYHVSWYEDEFTCPQDCVASPNLDVSSSVTGSCFMQGAACGDVCGDGICSGGSTDDCVSCPRDCGECPAVAGDSICSYPFEEAVVGDCEGGSITNVFTFEGEDYASIDNAVALDDDFGDNSCTINPTAVPAGWRIADYDADVAKRLVLVGKAKFDTGCLVFNEGNAVSTDTGLQGDNETGCGIIPIVKYNGAKFAVGTDNCASRIMIQRIKAAGTKTCPSCSNSGVCNTLTGECACAGAWTGPQCSRAIGDFSVPPAASSWYQPSLGVGWEWQIDGAPIPGGNGPGSLYDVELYDIDYSYSSSVIADLQSKGKKVMCYISAGTSEDFRDDIAYFAAAAQGGIVSFGEGDVFADEKWLDLRRLDLIAPIMLERLDIMKAKGCDAVEWDNADLPVHETGLSDGGRISVSLQIAYNAWIAGQAHARGMGVAMKNNNEAAAFHVDDYDMVVNEECWINGNCGNYWPWIKAGKPILSTEYFTARCMYCTQANLMDLSTIKKVPDLTSCRVDCKSSFSLDQCDAAALSGSVTLPIDWTIGTTGEMSTNWCPMTTNTAADECPAERFGTCDPNVGY